MKVKGYNHRWLVKLSADQRFVEQNRLGKLRRQQRRSARERFDVKEAA